MSEDVSLDARRVDNIGIVRNTASEGEGVV